MWHNRETEGKLWVMRAEGKRCCNNSEILVLAVFAINLILTTVIKRLHGDGKKIIVDKKTCNFTFIKQQLHHFSKIFYKAKMSFHRMCFSRSKYEDQLKKKQQPTKECKLEVV